jgi:hypothetical protein
MADVTITLPATSPPSLVVDQDAAGNTIPTSKITTGAAGVNGGFVAPSNPLPVGFQDTGGNSQQPQLRLVNGVWTISVEDESTRNATERAADALDAILAIWQNTPVGDVTNPLAVQMAAPAPGFTLPPPSVGYDPRGMQPILCTINGLTSTSQRQSKMIYTGNLGFVDALVMVEVRSAAAATSATGIVNVYAYGSFDGQNFGETTVTGVDSAVVLTVPPNLTIIGTLNVVANATTYRTNPMSVASAFGGSLPPYWGIVVENKTSATLLAAGPSYSRYLGVY